MKYFSQRSCKVIVGEGAPLIYGVRIKLYVSANMKCTSKIFSDLQFGIAFVIGEESRECPAITGRQIYGEEYLKLKRRRKVA